MNRSLPLREPGEPSSRRLHVLHVSVATKGGAPQVALGYLRDQIERGWTVTVACPSTGTLGFEVRALGGNVRWWSATGEPGAGLPGEVRELRRILAEERPDLVHLHGAGAGLVGRLAVRHRTPTVFQPHRWSFLAATGALRTATLRWERFATRWTSELVCVSKAERALGEEVGVVAPTTLLANGVDLAALQPQDGGDRLFARKALGLPDAPTVVCAGRLSIQKGQQDLLADWPEIRRRVGNARLVLVGDGPDRVPLERQAQRLEGVRLVGERLDLGTWLAAADVVVVPSRWEAMPLVPLEAMAVARSVVATRVGELVDCVPDDAGETVPVGDGPALVDAVVRRLESPELAESEGWHGRSHVELNHDVRSSAQELARLYLRLVGSRRGR